MARRRGARRGPGPRRGAARRRAPDARAEPDARPARRAARPGHPRPVRDAGAGDRRGRRRSCAPRAATRGRRSWCRWSARCRSWRRYGPRPSRSSPRWSATSGVEVLIGTMIEVPRAALTAGQIAEAAEFFSFGTNDLTQMGWGFSRDDVEGAFFWPLPGAGHLRRLAVRVDRPRRRRPAGPDRGRGGPGGPAGPEDRRLRRARRRPGLGALLPRRRPGLRVLLAVPGAGGPAGGRPRGDQRRPAPTAADRVRTSIRVRTVIRVDHGHIGVS